MRERDRALVRRFVESRAEEAFRDLYRAHSPYLYGLALRLSGGRRDEADEALQEAWIRAAQTIGAFRWRSELRTWLGGILVNCCRELRRRRRWEVDEIDVDRRATDPPAASSIDGRLDLDRYLASLPESQRTVVVLFAIEGYTHEEIAALLGIAPGTSKSRLFEARRALRALRASHRQTGDAT